jgi:hypothetical protein
MMYSKSVFTNSKPIVKMSAPSNLGSFLLFLSGSRQRHDNRLRRVPAMRGLAQKPALLRATGTGEEQNRQSEPARTRDDAEDGLVQDIGRHDIGNGRAQRCRPEWEAALMSAWTRWTERPGVSVGRARPRQHGAAGIRLGRGADGRNMQTKPTYL